MILPKTLDYTPTSTTQILANIRAPSTCPLRVDFGGGVCILLSPRSALLLPGPLVKLHLSVFSLLFLPSMSYPSAHTYNANVRGSKVQQVLELAFIPAKVAACTEVERLTKSSETHSPSEVHLEACACIHLCPK